MTSTYHFRSNTIIEDQVIAYENPSDSPIPFRVLAFDEGEVVNFGNGGFINWYFLGDYSRHGVSSVSFDASNEKRRAEGLYRF